MPVRQRVVLGENRQRRARVTGRGAKRGLEPTEVTFNLDSQRHQRVAEELGGKALFELQLGARVDPPADIDRPAPKAFDPAADLVVYGHLRFTPKVSLIV